ncbi:cytochrome P450 [Flavobacterium soyangense]|uniref:Cytochrome P450 n=1 Tax=Flavobacterium soyangense TaxID=2023265 RepID=A0A930UC47_9FLAO|nr:cytochrome P450 [Flavobacterium soyangense]MBF2708117.1 cytochrome P450 [Flavobacterium soyangense]
MTEILLQSELKDPYAQYETLLSDNSVRWNQENKLWAIYSYENCKAVLNSNDAHIPINNLDNKDDGLNEYAFLVMNQVARLSNGIQHEIAKQTAMLLFGKMTAVSINEIFEKLIKNTEDELEIDWVDAVCKKLPINVVLKSFDFNDEDCEFISTKMEQLIKIMLPDKTEETVLLVNEVSKKITFITKNHLTKKGILKEEIRTLSEKHKISTDKVFSFVVSNLIGLFIQSYDAGRGVLSNSLLQALKFGSSETQNFRDINYLERFVIETLRFDSPIHNTRRVAVADIVLNNIVIKKGELLFLVLASANRDPKKFENPKIFDVERPNNSENLTFGLGSHMCLAKHFSVHLTARTLLYLFQRYNNIKLLDKDLQYEPMINARLPKQILISIS